MKCFTYLGSEFELILGSDVERDGMFLELEGPGHVQLAEVFYSDSSKKMSLTYAKEGIDVELLEILIRHARTDLPEQH